MGSDVRELTRIAVRTRLAESVYDLLADRGFDAVTVDEAARVMGVSRATFFRYFGTKEDVVLAAIEGARFDPAASLRSVVIGDGEPVWSIVRRAFEPAVEEAERRPEPLRSRIRLISSTPTIEARLMESRSGQTGEFAEVLAGRLAERGAGAGAGAGGGAAAGAGGGGETDPALAARVCSVAAFSVYSLVWREWARTPGSSFRALLDAAFVVLAAPDAAFVAARASSTEIDSA